MFSVNVNLIFLSSLKV